MIGGAAGAAVGAGAGLVGDGVIRCAVVGGAGGFVAGGALAGGAAVVGVVGATVVGGAVVEVLEPGASDAPERSMTSPRTFVGLPSSEQPTRPANATVSAIANRAVRRGFANISLSPWLIAALSKPFDCISCALAI